MIDIDIPRFGNLQVKWVVSDYTGTHAFGGTLRTGVKDRLIRLAELVELHFITSDTFGTVERELDGVSKKLKRLEEGNRHDIEKLSYVIEHSLDLRHVAAFGNGNNDRLLLRAVKDAGGLAVAVDNGEGCALDAILSANLLIYGSENALDLLLESDRCKATLRF